MTWPVKVLRRGLYSVGAVVIFYFLLTNTLNVAPGSLQLVPASDSCNQHRVIALGHSPSDIPWTVTGWIRKDFHSCKTWLFGVEFIPSDRPSASFSSGWGIPAGGHLSSGFTFSGSDANEGSERVFAGAAGVRVKSLLLTLGNGQQIRIHPLLPTLALRKQFVWLRDMRYFVQFYPPGPHVRLVTARNFKRRIVGKSGGEEGFFEGHCSPVVSCVR